MMFCLALEKRKEKNKQKNRRQIDATHAKK
jgi:hypothetical protein